MSHTTYTRHDTTHVLVGENLKVYAVSFAVEKPANKSNTKGETRMDNNTPTRRRVPCALGCGQTIDSEALNVYQYVTGWARNRNAGGVNALALRQPEPRYACKQCIDRHTIGGWTQPEMFARP